MTGLRSHLPILLWLGLGSFRRVVQAWAGEDLPASKRGVWFLADGARVLLMAGKRAHRCSISAASATLDRRDHVGNWCMDHGSDDVAQRCPVLHAAAIVAGVSVVGSTGIRVPLAYPACPGLIERL